MTVMQQGGFLLVKNTTDDNSWYSVYSDRGTNKADTNRNTKTQYEIYSLVGIFFIL